MAAGTRSVGLMSILVPIATVWATLVGCLAAVVLFSLWLHLIEVVGGRLVRRWRARPRCLACGARLARGHCVACEHDAPRFRVAHPVPRFVRRVTSALPSFEAHLRRMDEAVTAARGRLAQKQPPFPLEHALQAGVAYWLLIEAGMRGEIVEE